MPGIVSAGRDFGNTGTDHIYGNGGPDIIFGGKDDDKIDGGAWPDLISGGLGKDIILGGDGVDLIFGGPDGDYIYGNSDTDLLFGGRGTTADVIDGGPFKDIVFGKKGDDFLDGGGDKDRLWGGQGNDHLTARGDSTRLRGNKGDDQFRIDGGNSVHVHGGAGSDTYEVASGSTAKTTSASSGTVAPASYVPVMCAEIHGTKWRDDNGNGIRDAGEPGLVGVTICLDSNPVNGRYDSGEPWTVTMADNPSTKADETGMYWFTMLKPGGYQVREVLFPVWIQTHPPANGAHPVTLGPIDIVTERNFGNKPVCITPPSGLVLWLPLDETTGNTAYNRVGGPNGTHVGNPPAATGLVNSSRCYNEFVQYTEVPHHGLIDITTGDFSIDAWCGVGRLPMGTPKTSWTSAERRPRVCAATVCSCSPAGHSFNWPTARSIISAWHKTPWFLSD